jgi:hypothetical protein
LLLFPDFASAMTLEMTLAPNVSGVALVDKYAARFVSALWQTLPPSSGVIRLGRSNCRHTRDVTRRDAAELFPSEAYADKRRHRARPNHAAFISLDVQRGSLFRSETIEMA